MSEHTSAFVLGWKRLSDWQVVVTPGRLTLSGHAPPSYGGLLGSLGLFAGQNQSEERVYGKVKQPGVKGRYSAMGKPLTVRSGH